MNNTRFSRSFSIWFVLFLLSINLSLAPVFSQSQKDIEKAVKKQNIKKLIKLYDKAEKNLYFSKTSQITSAIAQMDDPRFFDDMVKLLKNEREQIRPYAAMALGKMKDPRTVEPLILALNEKNQSVRGSVVHALAKKNDLRAVKALARGITYENCRKNPDEWIYLKKEVQRLEAPLIEALKDADPLVRGGAAYALGNSEFTTAVEPLIAILKDEDINVRRLALLGLATKVRDSLTVKPLVNVALMDTDAEAKEIAMNALLRLKEPFPRAIEIYIAALNSNNKWTSAEAATNLLKLDTLRAVEFHVKAYQILLRGDDEKMRMEAAKALLKLKDPIPDELHTEALKIIDEETYIELFILYDEFQRKNHAILSNTDGRKIASQSFEYHDFNSTLISRTVTTGFDRQDTLRVIDYNYYAKPKNYQYLCFDKKGNIIKDGPKPVLVEVFQITQKEKSKISYRGFTKVKSFEVRKIYPCQDCAEKTSIDNCRYVW